MNNPVSYVDPSGNIIELSDKAMDTQIEEYKRAILYLQTTEERAALIKQLMDSTEVFTIEFNNKFIDNYEPITKTIKWYPFAGLVLSYEIPIAKELGKYTRKNYIDDLKMY